MKQLIIIISLFISSFASEQSETNDFITYDTTLGNFNGNTWQARISRPANYFTPNHQDTASRALIITMPGLGEANTNFAGLQLYGPHYWKNNGWNGSVVTGSGTHYPLLITVKATVPNPRIGSAINMLNALFAKFHPKANARHFAGLSMGAFTFAGLINGQLTGGGEDGMKLVTSLTLLQGAGQGATSGIMGTATPYDATGYRAFGHWAAKYGGKYFGLEGTNDGRSVWQPRDNIEDSAAGSAYFSYENYGGGSHCCWNTFYSPYITDWKCTPTITNANIATNVNHANSIGTYKSGSSLFQWMLRQGDTTLAGSGGGNIPPVVGAGTDQVIYLPTSSVTLSGSASDDGSIVSNTWTKQSGGSATIVSASSLSTSVTGLSEGVYQFQLSATDDDAATSTDIVQITVLADTTTYDNLPTGNKAIVGNGEYQVLFIDSLKHLWGLGNLLNIGVNGGGTAGVPQRVLVTPSDLKFRVAVGALHGGAAIDTAGYVWVMGDNDQYQHGQGNATANLLPAKILTDSAGNAFNNIRDLVGWFVKDGGNGYNGFYAVKQDGTLWTWGRTVFGMRGVGVYGYDSPRPVQIPMPGGRLIKQIIAGQFAIALCTDSTVWTWGQGASSNNLGLAAATDTVKWSPRQLTGLSNIKMIAGGSSWNYALRNDNVLYGWGAYGDFLGNSNGLPISTPTVLSNITNNLPLPISKIVTNSAATHVILTDSTLWGWGDNGQGTIGNGERVVFTIDGGNPFDRGNLQVVLPIHVAPGILFDTIFGATTYTYYSYARDTAGNLYCWGRGKSAVLANQLRTASANITSTYGNSWDIAYPTPVNPFTISTSYIQTSDYCVKVSSSGSPCNEYAIPANTAPVADAGANQSLGDVTEATLDATGSTDNVFISRYEWRQLTGPVTGVIDLPASKTPTVRGLADGTYTFELLTEDNGWLEDKDTVQITVNQSSNIPPVITSLTSTADTIRLPISTVKLTTVATDADGTVDEYLYATQFAPGFSIPTIQTADKDTTTITGLSVSGNYIFRSSITDNDGAVVYQDKTITVLPDTGSTTIETFKVNFYGGSNPQVNGNWNNLNIVGTGSNTWNNINDSTGAATNVSVVLNAQLSVITNSLQTGVMCPDTVLLNASYSTGSRTLTISGLENSAKYTWESYHSRNNSTITTVTIGGVPKGVNVLNNVSTTAEFTDIEPVSGQIIVTLTGSPNYINGFVLRRQGSVAPINISPIANAGTDGIIFSPTNEALLNGTSSSDPDGTIASVLWESLDSQYPVIISDATSLTPTVSGLIATGIYTFRITVTDNQGAEHSDLVQVYKLAGTLKRLNITPRRGRRVKF